MPTLIKTSALWIHQVYSNIYSSYKIRESGLKTSSSLTSKERNFYLMLRPILHGENIVVYDIGAAEGHLSQCLAKLKNVLEIHAFEPIPNVFNTLKSKVKNIPKIYCHNIAVGNFSGISTIGISSHSDSSSLLSMADLHVSEFPNTEIIDQLKVNMARLDDFVCEHQLPQADLVKIDVQGFEKNVIDGGLKTLKRAKYCVLEMSFKPLYNESPLFDEIYQIMRDLGFDLIGTSRPLIGKSGDYLQVDGIFENTAFKTRFYREAG